MRTSGTRIATGLGSVAFLVSGLLTMGSLAHATSTKTTAPAKAAPAAKPATSGAKPAGAAGGTAAHGATGASASHGPTANGSHGPTANGSHGPTANGGGNTHTPTAPGAANRSPGGLAGSHQSAIRSGPAPKGSHELATKSGGAIRTRPDGRVADVHDARRGMDIHHGLNGNRRVSVERADHSRLVAERGRPGYVQRRYDFHGHEFGHREYYYHGRMYDRYYRGYPYRGMYLNVYAPRYYYGPGFYGWAYNPWAVPIAYGWGWAGNPWYGFYGGYFAPYPVYPSAAFWLTDYIISQDLQAAYAAHVEAGEVDGAPSAAGAPPQLTPDVKQQIADEVRAQLALENQEATLAAQHQDANPASSGIERMMGDGKPHVFVAGSPLDVVDASGQECALSDGDALQLSAPPAGDATTATLVVLASKGGKECQKSSSVSVQLTDLQEMQNHMRETIDQGLQDLQARQGKEGLPAAPPSAQTKPIEAEYAMASNVPPPDPKDAADLQAQTAQADQAEKEVTAEAGQQPAGASPALTAAVPPAPAAPPAAPASVELGQTTDQVKTALGTPTKVATLGPKVIYYYDGMKVTFNNGKVSNVQ